MLRTHIQIFIKSFGNYVTVWTDKMVMTDNTVETDKNFDTNYTTKIVTNMKTNYTLDNIQLSFEAVDSSTIVQTFYYRFLI